MTGISSYHLNIGNVCEKYRAGDTAYTEDIAHQCKNLKERREEEYILLNKMVCKTCKCSRVEFIDLVFY